ncbi:MAG TPA: hypothetical protein VIF09_17595 [Polyangiaceae bacterium]
MPRFTPSSLALAALLLAATPARADESSAPHAASPDGAEVAVDASWAAATHSSSYDPFGYGLRARTGVLRHDLYVGIVFGGYGGAPQGQSSLLGGVQLGYGFRFVQGMLLLRPTIGAGILAMPGTGSTSGVYAGPPWADGKTLPIFVEPGVTFLVVPGPAFLGVNASLWLPAVDAVGAGGMPVGVSLAVDIGFRPL